MNTILIVDDVPANILSLSSILKDDYQTYTANSGKLALELADRFVPDLILLDVMMPDMDGFAVLEKLRGNEKTQSIPVIFITGLGDNEDENEGFTLGAADYIKRPFDATIVKHRVRNQINIINLQRQLKDALKTAEEANRTKSEFLVNMNHEIRTPMNAIIGLTERLLDGDCSEGERQDFLKKIYNACADLMTCVNSVGDVISTEELNSFIFAKDQIQTAQCPDLSHATVLVVDDFPTNLDVAKGFLGKYKINVDTAQSGKEALERIESGKPVYSAVFMDHMMPGMDGIETTHRIRALDSTYAQKVPIIALTANAMEDNEKMFLENGFQDYISKPVNKAKIDAAVRRWIMNSYVDEYAEHTEEQPQSDDAQPNTQVNIPGINAEAGLELYDGDVEMFAYIMQSFVENIPAEAAKLHNVTEENLREYAIDAHTVKGSAASIGADQLAEFAKKMEMTAKAGDLPGVLAENDAFIKAIEKLVSDIERWLKAKG